MVSITHVLKKASNRRQGGRGMLLALCLGFLSSGQVLAESFDISRLSTRLDNGVYLLDADVDIELTAEPLEALESGVPLTLLFEFDVERKRRWWLDADVATLEQRYLLQFHALSHRYMLTNLNSGAIDTYPSLTMALFSLGNLRDFPLLDEELIETGERYEVEMRVELDIEALPSPLRPVAYLTPSWRLKSDWYAWSLKP